MSVDEADVKRLSRVLSQISHTLETSDERMIRVERSLSLAREIIPSARAALLELHDGVEALYVSPSVGDPERAMLTENLAALYRLVAGGDEIGPPSGARPSLALPVMGLDQIIGVIRVEPDGEPYDARHLRLLSVVAAQLGAYLAMVRLRDQDRAHTQELAAAHDFQRLLAGVVGHDLRNPLAVITAVAESLLESTKDERQVRALQQALRNAEHASKLITDLVDVTESRVSGTIRVVPASGDFREVVEHTIEDLRQAHASRTIELAGPEARIEGSFDPLRFAQIVTNLVTNALVHGEPSLPIGVRLAPQGSDVVLSVRNWGAPIPARLLPTIFDPFKQGPQAMRPRNTRGLGLGLYIVDQLCRGHGGRVSVSSDAETGTVFTVRLPRSGAPAQSVQRSQALVMVVDDDEDIRLGISAILHKRGYDVATAIDGRDALQQLQEGLRPDLILLDYSMPVMNGEAFCDACSHDPALAQIPIVVVSSDTVSAVKLTQTHARECLAKPVPVDRLLEAIERSRL